LPLEWNTLFLEGLVLLESILANFNLHFLFLGLLRSLYPQQGQIKPSHLMKILHIWHRFWPSEYLPSPNGFSALSLRHIPLQAITNDIPSCSLANFCQVFYFYWLLFCNHFLLPIFFLDDLIQDFSRCTVSHLCNLYEYFHPRIALLKDYESFYFGYSCVSPSAYIFYFYIITSC
jgi:hypothetical protein